MTLAVAVEDVVVLNRHVAHGNVVLRDEREIAVGPPDLEQARQAVVGLHRRHGVAVAVVPVQPVGHGLGNVVGVRVAHAGRNREQHVVGVAVGTDVQPVGVQVERRLGEHRRVDRNLAARGRERRVVEVLDVQTRKIVVEMDDQFLAGIHPQCRRRIEVVALGGSVRAGALDEVVTEDKEIGDGFLHGVEVDRALVRRQPHLENPVLAGQPDRFLELRRLAVRACVDTRLRRRRLLLPAA